MSAEFQQNQRISDILQNSKGGDDLGIKYGIKIPETEYLQILIQKSETWKNFAEVYFHSWNWILHTYALFEKILHKFFENGRSLERCKNIPLELEKRFDTEKCCSSHKKGASM